MKSIILLIMLFFLIGCGKDSPTVVPPEEEKPEEPIKDWIDGADGSKIFTGSKAPESAKGANGDLYINISNGYLYGPKTDNSWGEPFNLIMEGGGEMTSESKIHSGRVIPNFNIGNIGDFYINLKTMIIYGPKTNRTWGYPISLKSDKVNGVSKKSFAPDWNKYLVIDSEKRTFTTMSQEYELNGNSENTKFVTHGAVALGSGGLKDGYEGYEPFIGEYPNQYKMFDYIVVSLHIAAEDIKMESVTISESTHHTRVRYKMSGKIVTLGTFGDYSAWVMVKSYDKNALQAKYPEVKDMDKFLRLK